MKDLYLYAMANLAVCGAIAFIALCRLNAMRSGVLLRVRLEYAGYVAGATAAAFQPLWGEWPQLGSLSIALVLLLGLLCSGRAWAGDVPPDVATDRAPLSDTPEIPQ
ncbi:hypothetical protein J2W28_000981 [Variovorax boronicumulans]|uniref:hypothetical protein n=1 Tax=Variovorax boronicumulans TaxID=436515 RepID=UPI0027897F26|nr:hypothetical protein [Variovorax boronicumulans]MDP9991953.1 hypothetical protein [Variovorax boronicumulans]MDQ0001848.1 hypothetical protein [Variovorax boronicumulans]